MVSRPRSAHTLIELALVLVIIGLTTLVMLRQLQLVLDRVATRSAARAAGELIARAREESISQQTMVALHIDTSAAVLDLRTRTGSLARAPLGTTYGVSLSATRDSIAFDVRGLGYGAANVTLIARRGVAANTVFVSRLGRVRY
ncbi:MAG TPA: type II secretion system protein [Gemmatimonadaceae bacterium]